MGIYDGHNGPYTSAFLMDMLPAALVGALSDLFSKREVQLRESRELGSEPVTRPTGEEIDQTIKETFLRVDDDIVNWNVDRAFSSQTKEAALKFLQLAQAGSCALLAFWEEETRLLRVALTGDSRAVLGRRTKDERGRDTYEVHVLSVDQNASNPAEEARMNAEHPDEKVIENGRILGWGISRAFGDAAMKWSRDLQARIHSQYLGDSPWTDVKTPPYFTAEPEITTTEVQHGDFLVMASDGLWDCLTNEEVVGLVGVWLEKNSMPSNGRLSFPADGVVEPESLPVTLTEDQRTPVYRWWRAKKRFLNVDDNVATHLVRNALGGADTELTSMLLSLNPSRSRRFRFVSSAVSCSLY